MIVFDVAMTAPLMTAETSSNSSKAWMQALIAAPALKPANITNLAINLQGKDERGPYVLLMTMPISAVEGSLNGTLSNADAQKVFKMEVVRGN